MEPTRADRILQKWDEVASRARRPAAPPVRVAVGGGPSLTTLAGTGVILAALLMAFLWIGRPGSDDQIGADPPILPSPSGEPTSAPTPTPEPSGALQPVSCIPNLDLRITSWEGAAGHRIAHLEMTNTDSLGCTMPTMDRPQLVDGRGSVLIDGSDAPASAPFTLAPRGVVTTLVQVGNYCGPAPVAPVTVAFVRSDGRILATPASPTDTTFPPCLGEPGSPGTIEMQPWAP